MRETRDFFANNRNQAKLEALKKLIVDNQYQERFNNLYKGIKETPQSQLNEMNMAVTYNPYSEKE